MDKANGPHTSLSNGDNNADTKNGPLASDNTKVLLTRHPDLVMIKDTPKGRGVFATAPIPGRTVIEVSPVLVLDPDENEKHIRHTKLWFYTYNWRVPSRNRPTQALPLGLGSLFNHASSRSRRHNTGFMRDWAAETISYMTLRDVHVGEELCICYGEDGRLGFVDADGGTSTGDEEAAPDSGNESGGDAERGPAVDIDVDIFSDGDAN